MNTLELQQLAGGSLQEKANAAMISVIENMQDPNTPWKNKRGITIKLAFTQNEESMNAIGTYIQYLTGDRSIAKILGYEIRQDITYIIVADEIMESRINILNEGKIFEFVK